MTIMHHLDDATLMSYAAGSLPMALSAVAAAHVAMCPRCRQELAHCERIGGVMVASVAPAAMARAEPAAPAAGEGPVQSQTPAPGGDVPRPLTRLLGHRLDDIKWKHLGPGLWHYLLPLGGEDSGNLHLIKAAPGCSVPAHGHDGAELTLILQGSYHDEIGAFRIGDVADVDGDIDHHPVADDAGCICLVASEKPARYHGLVARLYAPLRGL